MNADVEVDPLSLFDHVYATPTPQLLEQRAQVQAELEAEADSAAARPEGEPLMAGPTLTMAGAINRALRDAMTADDDVLVFGEDVGHARRCLPGHRRPGPRLRRAALLRHPAGRVRHRRLRGRHGHGRLPAGRRDAVRRVRLPGVRADRLARGQDAQPHPRRGQPADRHPGAVRRRHRRRRAPLRLQRGLLRPHPGPEGRHAGDGRGRLLAAARGDRRPRPGGLHGAEEALLEQGRGRAAGQRRAVRHAPRCAARDATPPSSPTGRASRSPWRPPRPPATRAGTSRSSTCAPSCRSTTRRSWPRCGGPGGAS